MSKEEIDKVAKEIKPIIEKMSLELYKKKPTDVVTKLYLK
jgi:hypothetical protein